MARLPASFARDKHRKGLSRGECVSFGTGMPDPDDADPVPADGDGRQGAGRSPQTDDLRRGAQAHL